MKTFEEFLKRCTPGTVLYEVEGESITPLVVVECRHVIDNVYACKFNDNDFEYILSYEGEAYVKYRDIMELRHSSCVGYGSVVCLDKEAALDQLLTGLTHKYAKISMSLHAMREEAEETLIRKMRIESYRDHRSLLVWAIENEASVTVVKSWEKHALVVYAPDGTHTLKTFKTVRRAKRYAYKFKLNLI